MVYRKKIKMVDKKLGELLVEWKIIEKEHLDKALSIQKNTKSEKGKPSFSGEILIKLGVAKEENIIKALVVQYQFPYIPIMDYKIDPELARILPADIAKRYNIVPVEKVGAVLSIAMSNPLDEEAINAVEGFSFCNTQVLMSSSSQIQSVISTYYN